ncbi:MAG: FIST N-terminal domain-containing protein [Campylobacterales bacterium]
MKTKTYRHIEEAGSKFSEAPHVLVQIFTEAIDPERIEMLIARVGKVLPQAAVIGMTTDIAIEKGRLVGGEDLFVVSSFEASRVRTVLTDHPQETERAVADAFGTLMGIEDETPKAAIILATAFSLDGDRVAKAASKAAPGLTIAGGLASDHRTFSKTYVFNESGITHDGFAVAMLYGDELQVGSYYDLNWRGLGKKFRVTEVKGNRVYSLENEPTIDVYRRYLGSEVRDKLPAIGLEFPLIQEEDGVTVARAVMKVHDDGSLTFAGGIKEGTEVQFGFADIENMLDDTNRHNRVLASHSVESIFVYSCIARYTLVGEAIESETLQMQHIAPTAGAFTYGEFFHDALSQNNRLFNQSMTALLLSEGGQPRLEQKRQRRRDTAETTYARVLSHFIHEMTSDLEAAYEAEKTSKEIMLRQARQATMGEIIEMIAHQWRQPLNIVALTLQELYIKGSLGSLDTETLESLYTKANASIQYLSETIDDFRNFFKPDNQPEAFEIASFIEEIGLLLAGLMKRHRVTLNVSVADTCTIVSRRNELKQVIVNLINNAVEAMPGHREAGRRVDFTCRREGKSIVFEVFDNAGGIDGAIIDRIFEPYFTTKGEHNGTGLGLYIVSQIVEKSLSGRIDVANTHEGACFTLTLPEAL